MSLIKTVGGNVETRWHLGTGREALIKGNEVISIWRTQRDALQAGRDKFGLQDIAVVKIDNRDPERFRLIDSGKVTIPRS